MQTFINKEDLTKTGVYSITNTVNGKKYIGSTTTSFRRRYKSYIKNYNMKMNKKLLNGINKYGFDNFIFEIVEICPIVITRCREEYFILQYNTVNDGYNIKYTCSGGNGGANKGKKYPKPSKELIMKRAAGVSKALKGVPKSVSHRAAMSEVRKGHPPTHSLKVKILNTETNEVLTFNSATEAAKKLSCSIQQVCSLVKGMSKRLKTIFTVIHQTSE